MTLLIGVLTCFEGTWSWANPNELRKSVPGDIVAAYFVGGGSTKPPRDGEQRPFEFATFIIDEAFQLGLLSRLDTCTRAWLDTLAAVSVVLKHPHAAVLFDIHGEKADEDSYRLSDLHAAVVLHTKGDNARIEQRIQHLLGSYTNRDETVLKTIDRDGARQFQLRDRRLADWVVLSWGQLGDYFLLGIGEGSFERVADTLRDSSASVAADSWFRGATARMAAQDALLSVYVRMDELRRTAERAPEKRIERVLEALDAKGCERGLWALGYSGRSIEIRQTLKFGSADSASTVASADVLEGSGIVIPESATAFTAIDVDPRSLMDRIRTAYLAARSPGNRAKSVAFWRDVESRAGIQIERDIFAPVSGPIVVHDAPPHAFRLPPAWTIVVPIKGDADRLRRGIDGLLSAWQKELGDVGTERLRHDGDGAWHLNVGIDGPALLVTDHYLIISFSPFAVLQNAEWLDRTESDPSP